MQSNHFFLLCLLVSSMFAAAGAFAQEASSETGDQPTARESDYYRIETLPIPEDVVLEVGGLALLPTGDVAASTRRGDVWIVENPYMMGGSQPHYRRYAQGLHEALGLAYHDGDLYAHQRGELTRLVDTDGDWKADRYEAVVAWPLEGNYHEYSYGPLFLPNGNMLVTLNLGWIGHGASLSKWRGWAVEVTPEGEVMPYAAGMRSPSGIAFAANGDVFFSENQGDWIGSGYITHIERGDFAGHPASLRWADDPASPLDLAPEDIPDTGEPISAAAAAVPALKPPSVWFPHILVGISTSGMLADTTGGAFGPFAGQMFVGDQGHSRINRVFLEKIDGEYQGAVFPFLKGFASGVLRMIWGRDGSMFVGMTDRGWDSLGEQPYGLQRVAWTGETPFEVEAIRAMPDGFELTFTMPAAASAADTSAYDIESFTYQYHHHYGSPMINQESLTVRRVELSDDGKRARLFVDGLREGYIHAFTMKGLVSAGGESLLHDEAFYSLNRLPAGAR